MNDIALYVEVVKQRSFGRAAARLAMPASTLARRVRTLENRIGVDLIKRGVRRVILTDEGDAYHEYCRQLIDRMRRAHETLLELASKPRGVLRVSVPGLLAHMLLPAVMRTFGETQPDILCEISVGSDAVDPISNPFDIALRFGRQPNSTLVARHLATMDCGMYAAPSYLDKRGRPKAPADLAKHDCLRLPIQDHRAGWCLRRGRTEKTIPVRGRLSANNGGVLYRLAVAGAGIVALPLFDAMGDAIRRDGLEQVLPEWEMAAIPLYALLPSRSTPERTQAFLRFLADCF
ncbi:LysR family transcriptional regulator [Bordetella sp. N]|uniref:LysR family transcriptional regulator n=1 Tax=Bordetella sp. N TaxID=1746199 RepID=UPI001E4827F2|nr:LysR family transcriptional regulator [Bordetella sp. N]